MSNLAYAQVIEEISDISLLIPKTISNKDSRIGTYG